MDNNNLLLRRICEYERLLKETDDNVNILLYTLTNTDLTKQMRKLATDLNSYSSKIIDTFLTKILSGGRYEFIKSEQFKSECDSECKKREVKFNNLVTNLQYSIKKMNDFLLEISNLNESSSNHYKKRNKNLFLVTIDDLRNNLEQYASITNFLKSDKFLYFCYTQDALIAEHTIQLSTEINKYLFSIEMYLYVHRNQKQSNCFLMAVCEIKNTLVKLLKNALIKEVSADRDLVSSFIRNHQLINSVIKSTKNNRFVDDFDPKNLYRMILKL